MIDKVILYKCKYCGSSYKSEQNAIDCLNSHNIIFAIEKYVVSHDCWGLATGDWVLTDKIFKTYESALYYIKDSKVLRITCKELSD